MNFKTLDSYNFKEKKVLLRIDINSPVVKNRVEDSPRFKEAALTIKELLSKKAKLVIIAHQGRKGSSDFLSLKEHSKILSKYVKSKIDYVDSLFEQPAIKEINSLSSGKAILLKNTRFYEDESSPELKNNKFIEFSKQFDFFINDAFSVSHRNQASLVIPPKYTKSAIGRNLERELFHLDKIKIHSNKKAVFLIGGAKVEDYFPIFDNLKNKKAKALVSGVMANLFLIASGKNLGYENQWLKEKGYYSLLPKIKSILRKYNSQILLIEDVAFENKNKKREELSVDNLPIEKKIWDVGHKTVSSFIEEINKAEIIFMKGPLGFSEIKEFSYGTVSVLNAISSRSKIKGVTSILGGGHLSTTISKYKIKNNFSYISSSGGALISYISSKKMPGLEALRH